MIFNIKITFTNLIKVLLINYLRNLNFIIMKLPNVGTSIFPVMTALANKHGAINLAQGFPGFGANSNLLDLVSKHITEGKNQYAPLLGLLSLREKLAEKISDLYGFEYNPENEICITAGATQAIYTSISAIIYEGDEVIIIEPAYDCYEPAVILNKGVPIRSQLKQCDYSIDWEDVKGKVSERTKMIVVNSPQNPSGTVWNSSDIQSLKSIVLNTNIVILSDEVYEHLTYDGKRHESICRYPELAERSFTIYSFGKTYHVTGWRMGYVCAPKELMDKFVNCHQFQVYAVNTPFQYAISDFTDNKDAYLELNQFFQDKRDFFLDCLKGSRFQPKKCSGTYFQLLDYSNITNEDDKDFANRLTIDYGIASIPISGFFHNKRQDQVLRFCFAKNNDELEKGAECLHKL